MRIADIAPARTLLILSLVVGSFVTAAPAPATDFDSPETVIAAAYQTLIGQPGTPRNWDRFRSLFASNARIIIRTTRGEFRAVTVDEFISLARQRESVGVNARELARGVQRYGHIAQAWSSFEAVLTSGGNTMPVRGVNGVQMADIGGRWQIVAVVWESELTGGGLPADLAGALR